MISKFAKRTLIYSELSVEKNKEFFDYKSKKFLHNIDSFYYVIKVKNDWNYDENCLLFKAYLEDYKQKSRKTFELLLIFQHEEEFNSLSTKFIMNGISFQKYEYDFGIPDKFTCFVLANQLNSDMPEFWVQVRSECLWLDGEHKAITDSINEIKNVLDIFGIEIEKITENRIDFAYHTNIVQDPTNFFQPKNYNRMQQSHFKRWGVQGSFSGQFDTDTDYFTLGRKKSNNLFFRVYDKTKEVIEKQYKQFFIKLWYLEKMISYFDYYCIEKAFLHVSNDNYKYLNVARLEFYLENGKDDDLKNEILSLINNKNRDYEKIEKLADKLVPRVTIILNIEIETKRKFYKSMDNSVDSLLKVYSDNVPEYAKKIYLILDNKQVFHDYLVCNNENQDGIIRFLNFKAKNRLGKGWTNKSKYPTADWWIRLQKVIVQRKFRVDDIRLIREYQQKLSADILKKRITNSITTYSLYLHGDDVQNNVHNDVLDYLSTLNENDIEKALDYKRKKIALLHNRLGDVEGVQKFENTLRIYDKETGQSF